MSAEPWWTEEDEIRAREHRRRVANGTDPSVSINSSRPRVLSSGAFVRDFVPPDYVLDGILQRGFLYSLTAPTGTGKTAIALRLIASVALGRDFAGRGTQCGRVLMLVGENADDVRARWIALSEQMGFDVDDTPAHFMPGVCALDDVLPMLIDGAEANEHSFGLVIVDTSAAYFQGEDENSNKEAGDHARMLRSFTRLPGNPCVIANCHPTKNALENNLLPRGGGAFVAEMDGNLTCSKADRIVELHWQGKFRGPDFEPIPLELVTVTSPRLVDSRGRPMPTVVVRPLSETEKANREDVTQRELLKLLAVMAEHPDASIADMAKHAGWTVQGGLPHKSKVHRHLLTLNKEKLVTKELGTWTLTPNGTKTAKKGAK